MYLSFTSEKSKVRYALIERHLSKEFGQAYGDMVDKPYEKNYGLTILQLILRQLS